MFWGGNYDFNFCLEEYVMCHTCKSTDTELTKVCNLCLTFAGSKLWHIHYYYLLFQDTRLFFLQCQTCGSRCSVTAIKSGFTAMVGKVSPLCVVSESRSSLSMFTSPSKTFIWPPLFLPYFLVFREQLFDERQKLRELLRNNCCFLETDKFLLSIRIFVLNQCEQYTFSYVFFYVFIIFS